MARNRARDARWECQIWAPIRHSANYPAPYPRDGTRYVSGHPVCSCRRKARRWMRTPLNSTRNNCWRHHRHRRLCVSCHRRRVRLCRACRARAHRALSARVAQIIGTIGCSRASFWLLKVVGLDCRSRLRLVVVALVATNQSCRRCRLVLFCCQL